MKLNKYIDHTLLKPQSTEEEVKKLCDEAKEYDFASVCVNGCFAKFVKEQLKESDVKTCCVIGFPLGAMSTASKVEETKQVIADGAEEVDMVINVGYVKAKDWEYTKNDIQSVVNATKGKALLKVIIETCLLTNDEKVKVCQISKEVGAEFVKTSTGFSTGGATVEDVKLMRETVGPNIGVKASGGVRSLEDTNKMIEAGATRIGTSSGIKIVQ